VCQASNSSQQLLIAGHWQSHVAIGGGASAIRQHAHFVEAYCSASLLPLPRAPQLSRRMQAFNTIKLPCSVR
jgi:hypothetical protein